MSAEELLEKAAAYGSWDTDRWPRILDDVLARLNTIVESEFPRPKPPSPTEQAPFIRSPRPPKPSSPSSQESQATNKENAPPPPRTPSQPAASQSLPSTQISSSTTADASTSTSQDLPPAIADLHNTIRKTLQSNFRDYPPHTVQRMAELLLRPKQHYRFLLPYLRALDRVVNVQNNVTAYPLPTQPTPYMTGLPNGTGTGTLSSSAAASSASAAALGSDESLGGALLTPIPWLRDSQEDGTGASSAATNGDLQLELQSESTEMVQGPRGAGRVETVSVINGVVTTMGADGPLLSTAGTAQEGTPDEDLESRALSTEMEIPGIEEQDRETEVPHARGPDVLGLEDLGPQSGAASVALGLDESGRTTLGAGTEGRGADPATAVSQVESMNSPEIVMAEAGADDTRAEASEVVVEEKKEQSKDDADAEMMDVDAKVGADTEGV